jgi:hypothetical protein
MTVAKKPDINSGKNPMRGVHPQQKKVSVLAPASGTGNFPNFINHGGPVINTPQIYILFLGDWQSAANQNRASRLTQFVKDFLNSRYMNILSQYGCGTSGTVVNSVFVESSNQNLSGSDINNIFQAAIGNRRIPEPTNHSNAYVLFLDDNTGVNDADAGAVMCEPNSDTAFGYHDSFTTTAGNVCVYSVIPNLTDSCLTETCQNDSQCSLHLSLTQEQRQTQVASHELSEMFSDPQPQSNPAWTDLDPNTGENGDLCNGQSGTITVGSNTWTVQRMYSKWDDQDSNGATMCMVEPTNPVPPPTRR